MAQGTFRWVAKGTYAEGERQGQECVAKWFKSGSVMSEDYFALDIKAVDKAVELAEKFKQAKVLGSAVKVNVASVWTFKDGVREGQKALIEPFIPNYRKFNSNSGWNDESTAWSLAMQALSHFSYHITNGNYLLCDLQGGVSTTPSQVILSDPVILSRSREFGVTDLGPDGIESFFSSHVCNRYCNPKWATFANPRQFFRPQKGTSMMARTASTQGSAAVKSDPK